VRETEEEAGFKITTADLHLFGMIAEKAYEGQSHWLLFLFRCRKLIAHLPPEIDEGSFGYFSREALNALSLPETDRIALWPLYDKFRDRFVSVRANCMPGQPLQVEVEEVTPPEASGGSSA
jgi:8-oxo-dGTP diphosphatase